MDLISSTILAECALAEGYYYRCISVPAASAVPEFLAYIKGMETFWTKMARGLFGMEGATQESSRQFGRLLMNIRTGIIDREGSTAPSGYQWPARPPWDIVISAFGEAF